MNSYLYSELYKNAFMTNARGVILGRNFDDVSFKIDTGCTSSVVPIRKLLMLTEDEIIESKKKDILDNVECKRGYRVESSGIEHKSLTTLEDKMNCPALGFTHLLTDCVLNEYHMPDFKISVNYNRHGNILLGMDFLSKFDIHIGLSSKINKIVFLGVLRDQSNKSDYEHALYEHFHITHIESQIAESCRDLFKH